MPAFSSSTRLTAVEAAQQCLPSDRSARPGPHRITYSDGLAADVRPAAPAFGSKRFSPGNPADWTTDALATEVKASGRDSAFSAVTQGNCSFDDVALLAYQVADGATVPQRGRDAQFLRAIRTE